MPDPSPYQVRPAVFRDAQGIAHVHIQSWQAAYAELMPAEVIAARSLAQRTAQWQQWMSERPHESIWVTTQEDRILGFVAGGPTRGTWAAWCPGEIYALYLDPSVFGQGLGARLLQQMIEHLKSQGYASQWVWVLTIPTREDFMRRWAVSTPPRPPYILASHRWHLKK